MERGMWNQIVYQMLRPQTNKNKHQTMSLIRILSPEKIVD
jgi:hypothetical protein